MKGYWKIFLQSGPVATMQGWGDLVRECNAQQIVVGCATSDVIPQDIQNNSINRGNFIATVDENGNRFDFDHYVYKTESDAHAAWKRGAADRWARFKKRIPTDLNPAITALSIENEQRGWVGWGQDGQPGDPIPGFTGWADCEGWQAYYTALEILKEQTKYRYMAFAYSAGLPEINAWTQPGMKKYLRLCAEHNGRFGVALHEYSIDDDLMYLATVTDDPAEARGYRLFRFTHLFAACDQMGIRRPQVQIKEFGYHQDFLGPSENTMKQDLIYAASVYAQYPEIELVALWTAQKGWNNVNLKVQSLIPWLEQMATSLWWELPDPMPEEKTKFVEFIYPQEVDFEIAAEVFNAGWHEYKRTVGGSVGHAVAAMQSPDASSDSYVVIFEPQYPSQQRAIAKLTELGIKFETRLLHPEQKPFAYEVWPTDYRYVTQQFGANPQNYPDWSGGHEGVDIYCPFSAPYYAPLAGTITRVSDRRSDNTTASKYGWHVVIDHGNGYSTLLAHAAQAIPVKVGDKVSAGDVVAYSGNTGNSYGPHQHFTLKIAGEQTPGYPADYVNPWPYLDKIYFVAPKEPLMQGWAWDTYLQRNGDLALTTGNINLREKPDSSSTRLRVVPIGEPAKLLSPTMPQNGYRYVAVYNPNPKTLIDMAGYLLPAKGQYGRAFTLKNNWGEPDEIVQLQQPAKNNSLIVKNQSFEYRLVGTEFIHFLMDTSYGGGKYYLVESPTGWMPRLWTTGNRFTRTEQVRLFEIANCKQVGGTTSWTTDLVFLGLHRDWEGEYGIKLQNVIEVQWYVNGIVEETYFYAQSLGLVEWRKANGRISSILSFVNATQIHEKIPCYPLSFSDYNGR